MISVSLFNQYIYMQIFLYPHISIHIYIWFICNANAHTSYLVKNPSSWGTNIGAARELCANFRRGHCNRLLDPSWERFAKHQHQEKGGKVECLGEFIFLKFISEILQRIAFVSAICFPETSRCFGGVYHFGDCFLWSYSWMESMLNY